MLREQVLREWKSYKEKVLTSKKRTLTKEAMSFLESLTDNLMDMPIEVNGSLTVNGKPGNLKDYLRHKFPRIDRDCQELDAQYRRLNNSSEEGSAAEYLVLAYIGYSDVVKTYKRFKDL